LYYSAGASGTDETWCSRRYTGSDTLDEPVSETIVSAACLLCSTTADLCSTDARPPSNWHQDRSSAQPHLRERRLARLGSLGTSHRKWRSTASISLTADPLHPHSSASPSPSFSRQTVRDPSFAHVAESLLTPPTALQHPPNNPSKSSPASL
jgi:hypothetical protein